MDRMPEEDDLTERAKKEQASFPIQAEPPPRSFEER
jgi:hypothetical protein